MDDTSYTAKGASQLLGISDKTIGVWLKQGKFPNAYYIRVNGLRQWSIPYSDLVPFLPSSLPSDTSSSSGTTGSSGSLLEVWEAIHLLQQEIEILKQRPLPEVLEASSSSGSVLEKTSSSSRTTRSSRRLPEVPVVKAKEDMDLPPGYIPLVDFIHGIPETSWRRWSYEFPEEVTQGHWKVGKPAYAVKYALSPEQQKSYYDYFVQHPRWISCGGKCGLCPS